MGDLGVHALAANGGHTGQQRQPIGHPKFHIGGRIAPAIGDNFGIESAAQIFAHRHAGLPPQRCIGADNAQPVKTNGTAQLVDRVQPAAAVQRCQRRAELQGFWRGNFGDAVAKQQA